MKLTLNFLLFLIGVTVLFSSNAYCQSENFCVHLDAEEGTIYDANSVEVRSPIDVPAVTISIRHPDESYNYYTSQEIADIEDIVTGIMQNYGVNLIFDEPQTIVDEDVYNTPTNLDYNQDFRV